MHVADGIFMEERGNDVSGELFLRGASERTAKWETNANKAIRLPGTRGGVTERARQGFARGSCLFRARSGDECSEEEIFLVGFLSTRDFWNSIQAHRFENAAHKSFKWGNCAAGAR
jgi:hypothetical protein